MTYTLHIPSQRELIAERIKAQKSGPCAQFAKGRPAWNKGLKGVMRGGEATQFKPGQLPHNTKYDGCISVRADGYKYIRLELKKWVLYHRYLWEQTYGPIPPGMILVFKDRNPLNCDLDNLELISRRENLRRNSNRKKAAESLKRTWQRDAMRVKYGLSPQTRWFKKKLNKL